MIFAVLEVLGLALIVAGVAFVFWPAALMLAGLAFVAFGVIADASADATPPKGDAK